jgi:hypothetical protein
MLEAKRAVCNSNTPTRVGASPDWAAPRSQLNRDESYFRSSNKVLGYSRSVL